MYSTAANFTYAHGRQKGGRAGLGPLYNNIWHCSITFLEKKVVFLLSRGKNEI